MQITPNAVDQALGLLFWGSSKGGHRVKKIMWPPQGSAQVLQEVRIILGSSIAIEVKYRVTPTAQHPSRVKWERVASVPYSEARITESGHLKLGPFTL